MTSGLTNGLGNRLTDEDAALPGLNAAGETAASEPGIDSDLGLATSTDVEAHPQSNAQLTSDSWRIEVAARLERYRTRRKPRDSALSIIAPTL